jgi:hypothetical protein
MLQKHQCCGSRKGAKVRRARKEIPAVRTHGAKEQFRAGISLRSADLCVNRNIDVLEQGGQVGLFLNNKFDASTGNKGVT